MGVFEDLQAEGRYFFTTAYLFDRCRKAQGRPPQRTSYYSETEEDQILSAMVEKGARVEDGFMLRTVHIPDAEGVYHDKPQYIYADGIARLKNLKATKPKTHENVKKIVKEQAAKARQGALSL